MEVAHLTRGSGSTCSICAASWRRRAPWVITKDRFRPLSPCRCCAWCWGRGFRKSCCGCPRWWS